MIWDSELANTGCNHPVVDPWGMWDLVSVSQKSNTKILNSLFVSRTLLFFKAHLLEYVYIYIHILYIETQFYYLDLHVSVNRSLQRHLPSGFWNDHAAVHSLICPTQFSSYSNITMVGSVSDNHIQLTSINHMYVFKYLCHRTSCWDRGWVSLAMEVSQVRGVTHPNSIMLWTYSILICMEKIQFLR